MADTPTPHTQTDNGHAAGAALRAPSRAAPRASARDTNPRPPISTEGDEAERLYGEAAVVLRRLRRLGEAARTAARRAPEGAYAEARQGLGAAEAALRRAMEALPEADPARAARHARDEFHVGALRVVPAAGRAWYRGRELPLSAKEFGLLAVLAEAPTRLHSKAELLAAVWGGPGGYRAHTRTLDSHASRLRRRLVAGGAPEGEWVINRWAQGYALRRPDLCGGSWR